MEWAGTEPRAKSESPRRSIRLIAVHPKETFDIPDESEKS
jgi:hypothetical protein